MPAATKQTYSRLEALRFLEISERQLRSWERQGLVDPAAEFEFPDLLELRALLRLRQQRVPPTQIRRVLVALRKRLGDSRRRNPLTSVRLYADGKRITIQFAGTKMEPISGQLLLNFDESEIARLLSFPGKSAAEIQSAEKLNKQREAEAWFELGLEMERTGATREQIVDAYQKAIEADPNSVGALVNLGTVHYNSKEWPQAERLYRLALGVDDGYALAHFNLGNLLDERGQRAEALLHYENALRMNANYADAHYNIALLHQAMNQPLKAVSHWRAYLKLDQTSEWAQIARRELHKLRELTIFRGAGPTR